MKATREFEKTLQDFYSKIRVSEDEDFQRDFAALVEENAKRGKDYAGVMRFSSSQDVMERFAFKAYRDPQSMEMCLAGQHERVSEWVDSVNDPEFQDALLPGNPEAHVVTWDPHSDNERYLAVCNDGFGHVHEQTFSKDDVRSACGFAWGMSPDEIKWARESSWGEFDEATGKFYPASNDTGDGFSYKNAFAFAMKSDDICYIPEYDFEMYGTEDGGIHVDDNSGEVGYSYQDIVDICNGNEKVAAVVFELSHWASPSTEYEQLEQWEIAEVIAGVDIADHTLLDYLGEGYKDIAWPVYQDVENDTLLAYCSTDLSGAPLNLTRLFVLKDEGNTPLNQAYAPEHEVRFVSTQGLELPECARIHNVRMQEKETFGDQSLGARCAEAKSTVDARLDEVVETPGHDIGAEVR